MFTALFALPALSIAAVILGFANAGGNVEFSIGCFITSGVALVGFLICYFLYRMKDALEQIIHDASALNR